MQKGALELQNRSRTFALVAVALAFTGHIAAPADAGFVDGNALYERCRRDALFCTGYAVGIADVLAKESYISRQEARICIPAGATSEQVKDIVMQYLSTNPQRRNQPAVWLTTAALLSAWQCPVK